MNRLVPNDIREDKSGLENPKIVYKADKLYR